VVGLHDAANAEEKCNTVSDSKGETGGKEHGRDGEVEEEVWHPVNDGEGDGDTAGGEERKGEERPYGG